DRLGLTKADHVRFANHVDRAMTKWLAPVRDAASSARQAADSPENLGLLGRLGLLTEEEQAAWLKGERIAAGGSVTRRRGPLDRANQAAEIFEQGAPGKRLHPWIVENQKNARKSLAEAEERSARVSEMEAGERSPAKKSAWRAAIEQSTAGAARGGARIT